MEIKVLVVDDEIHIRKLITDYLKNENYEVIEAIDGDDALYKFYENKNIDLVILDVMMPGKSGYEVAKILRKLSDIPIIFLTALSSIQNELDGFKFGADDYISKPFEYSVFIARVNSLLNRLYKKKSSRLNNLEINTNERSLKLNQKEIKLTLKEYELIMYLIQNKNSALPRRQILDNVWGFDFYGDERTVDTHIKQLRNKLGKEGDNIQTIRGFGYKFEVK